MVIFELARHAPGEFVLRQTRTLIKKLIGYLRRILQFS
jgi:hypothetical protein